MGAGAPAQALKEKLSGSHLCRVAAGLVPSPVHQ